MTAQFIVQDLNHKFIKRMFPCAFNREEGVDIQYKRFNTFRFISLQFSI